MTPPMKPRGRHRRLYLPWPLLTKEGKKKKPPLVPTNSILIVDDDREMRHLLEDLLEEHDYRVTVAPEGRAAPDHPGRCDALAVLTDLRMKGLDGFEILYEIIQRHPACNVLMLTASGTVESAVEARNQGGRSIL